MVERVQDLNLPLSVVYRLIKDAIPEGVNVSKEARSAISRAASVFVIYLSSAATTVAKKGKHKLLTPQNVFDALNEIEFENFTEPLQESLEVYRKSIRDKKENKKNKNTDNDEDDDDNAENDVGDNEGDDNGIDRDNLGKDE